MTSRNRKKELATLYCSTCNWSIRGDYHKSHLFQLHRESSAQCKDAKPTSISQSERFKRPSSVLRPDQERSNARIRKEYELPKGTLKLGTIQLHNTTWN